MKKLTLTLDMLRPERVGKDGDIRALLYAAARDYDAVRTVLRADGSKHAVRFITRVKDVQARVARKTRCRFTSAVECDERLFGRFCGLSGVDLTVRCDGPDSPLLAEIDKRVRAGKPPSYLDRTTLCIPLTDADDIEKLYRLETGGAVTDIHFPDFGTHCDIDELLAHYSAWLARGDRDIVIFSDVAKKALGMHSGSCRHNSCIGSHIYCDGTSLYLCASGVLKTKPIAELDGVNSVLRTFDGERFAALIGPVIDRRNECMDKCRLFKYCQGGCPAHMFASDGSFDVQCKFFRAAYAMTRTTVADMTADGVDIRNPVLRRIFYEAAILFPSLADELKRERAGAGGSDG